MALPAFSFPFRNGEQRKAQRAAARPPPFGLPFRPQPQARQCSQTPRTAGPGLCPAKAEEKTEAQRTLNLGASPRKQGAVTLLAALCFVLFYYSKEHMFLSRRIILFGKDVAIRWTQGKNFSHFMTSIFTGRGRTSSGNTCSPSTRTFSLPRQAPGSTAAIREGWQNTA